MCIRAVHAFARGNWFQDQWSEGKFCWVKSGFWLSGVNNPAMNENILKTQRCRCWQRGCSWMFHWLCCLKRGGKKLMSLPMIILNRIMGAHWSFQLIPLWIIHHSDWKLASDVLTSYFSTALEGVYSEILTSSAKEKAALKKKKKVQNGFKSYWADFGVRCSGCPPSSFECNSATCDGCNHSSSWPQLALNQLHVVPREFQTSLDKDGTK